MKTSWRPLFSLRFIDTARKEAGIVTALAAVAFCIWAFLSVAEEVMEGDTLRLDRGLLLALRQPGDPSQLIGPKWLHIAATDLTGLGSISILAVIVLLIAGLFVGVGKRPEALLLMASAGGGVALSSVLKLVFDRPRPDLALHAVEVVNSSFPSGHAMLSAVVFLTLGVLCAKFTSQRRLKVYALGAGVFLTVLVGLTRIYLGVHYPTDVLAGWCGGAAWASVCWLGASAWERRAGGKHGGR
jgi:undecaprenyl-diphosphatase